MKIHTARLLDRTMYPSPHITAQTDTGHIVHIHVREQDVRRASEHWGGSYVSYVYRGSKAYYASLDEE